MMDPILPWHEQTWQRLVNQQNDGKLPHAILIKGMSGVGKLRFAKRLATLLLCRKLTACGECDACQLVRTDNHPDLIMVQPEEAGKAIKIEQIRGIIADLNHTSHQGGYRVVIIESAELLNIAAANALLKTLEEPASQAIIILISAHPMLLPATMRSRCQTLTIHSPPRRVAEAWLKEQLPEVDAGLLLTLTENAPLKAFTIAEDGRLLRRQEFFNTLDELWQEKASVMQMVEHSLEWNFDDLILVLMNLVSDLIKIKLGLSANLINPDQLTRLTRFAVKTNLDKLLSYRDHLIDLRRHLFNKINLNQQLAVENLIITINSLC